MYCTNCGAQTGDTDHFCRECGHESPAGRATHRASTGEYGAPRRLYRSISGRKIAGVCAGLAQYLQVDVTLVRLVVAAATIFTGGLGLLAYIVAWIIMPMESRFPAYRATAGAPSAT